MDYKRAWVTLLYRCKRCAFLPAEDDLNDGKVRHRRTTEVVSLLVSLTGQTTASW